MPVFWGRRIGLRSIGEYAPGLVGAGAWPGRWLLLADEPDLAGADLDQVPHTQDCIGLSPSHEGDREAEAAADRFIRPGIAIDEAEAEPEHLALCLIETGQARMEGVEHTVFIAPIGTPAAWR